MLSPTIQLVNPLITKTSRLGFTTFSSVQAQTSLSVPCVAFVAGTVTRYLSADFYLRAVGFYDNC